MIIKTYNGFSCPTHGSITLPIEVGNKCLDVTFLFIPTFGQFQVRLGLPWLTFMKAISSPIHKRLKFPHNGDIITTNHSLRKPLVGH